MSDVKDLTEAEIQGFGYSLPRQFPTGEWAGIRQMYTTVGLFVGLNDVGYRCRFCYPSMVEAMLALAEWNGEGDDPPGRWVKQKGRASTGEVADRLNPRLAEEDF